MKKWQIKLWLIIINNAVIVNIKSRLLKIEKGFYKRKKSITFKKLKYIVQTKYKYSFKKNHKT